MKKATAVRLMEAELKEARERYGRFNSGHEGYAVIQEELDELIEVVKRKGGRLELVTEAAQVAAMAIRFLMELT